MRANGEAALRHFATLPAVSLRRRKQIDGIIRPLAADTRATPNTPLIKSDLRASPGLRDVATEEWVLKGWKA